MRFKVVAKLLGALLILLSLFMLVCGLYDLSLDKSEQTNGFFALSFGGGATFLSGVVFLLLGIGKFEKISRREGIAVVGLGWLFSAFFSAIPFIICEPFAGSGEPKLDIFSAIFEATSGISATGSTNLQNIEAWPKALLLWRGLTQWLGGLGILVIFVAVMSYIGLGARSLFRNESSFQTGEVSVSRIRDTAMVILKIYLLLTIVCGLGLLAMGFTPFDALAHTLTTVSTGGFSPKQDSIGYYSGWGNGWLIELWISAFMLICSVSFLVWVVLLKKRWNRLRSEEEGRFFFGWCVGVSLLIFGGIMITQGGDDWLLILRQAWFNTVSIASSTGYAVADYTMWPAYTEYLLLISVTVGGCSGSTTGGLKVSRFLVILRTSLEEVVRAFRPNKVAGIQINGNRLSADAKRQIISFVVLYILTFFVAVAIVGMMEMNNGIDVDTAFGMVMATMSNAGPGIGNVGPADNFSFVEPWTKLFLSFMMIVGRLELYTIFVLFVPSFWKRY